MALHVEPVRRDRRSPFGDAFLHAFAGDPDRALSFDDIVRSTANEGCRYSDVVSWIAHALHSEHIEEAGYEADDSGQPRGPRRYRITDIGLERARHDRRRNGE
jgi:hypothetical protein